MRTEYSSYLSTNTLTMVEYTVWLPEGQPKGIIQIIHGMSEHVGRYDRFAEFFVSEGYIICGNNHLGHGNSINKLRGYFGEEGSYKYLIADARKLTSIMKETYPGIDVILLGHSMGSFVTRLYMSKYPDMIAGVILSGTSGSNFKGEFPFYYYTKLLINLKGEEAVDRRINKLVGGAVRGKYKNSKSDWLTADKDVQEKVAIDEMYGFPFTLGGYREMFSMLRLVNSKSWAQSIKKELPIMFISGESDPVGDYGRGVRQVYQNLVDTEHTDLLLKLYPNGRHEMLNEVNYEEVHDDILKWIGHLYI